MTTTSQTDTDLQTYCEQVADRALAASRALGRLSGQTRTALLAGIADLLEQRAALIIEANGKDIARADEFGLTDAMVDRLRLDEARIGKMAASVRQIADQVDPVGQIIDGYVQPSGLRISKVRVPLGVVLFIYESRPNVTSDAAALCVKSGNAVILRGGKEAFHSNTAIVSVIRDAIDAQGVEPDIVQFIETTDRAAVGALTKMEGRIDVVIPRGGDGLIRAVVEQSRIPVIKHYTGNCHTYVDAHAQDMPNSTVRDMCVNAKVQRPGVCNATETMLFHADAAEHMVEACRALADEGVELRVCERSRALLEGKVSAGQLVDATESDWGEEYLTLTLAVKIVNSLDGAIDHINQYGSKHTDTILTSDVGSADRFVNEVDSANVMVNCSTRFSDGGEYGLGAEIGISTDKLHARGPMGAGDLTTYKWVVRGEGQLRT